MCIKTFRCRHKISYAHRLQYAEVQQIVAQTLELDRKFNEMVCRGTQKNIHFIRWKMAGFIVILIIGHGLIHGNIPMRFMNFKQSTLAFFPLFKKRGKRHTHAQVFDFGKKIQQYNISYQKTGAIDTFPPHGTHILTVLYLLKWDTRRSAHQTKLANGRDKIIVLLCCTRVVHWTWHPN